MERSDLQVIFDIYHRRLAATGLKFKRYLFDKINWNVQLIGIKGERGVGKTTLILQHIKESFANPEEALYVSLDNMWFSKHKLEDLVDYCYSHGIRDLYFDEVHRYRDWSLLLKNFVDNYPEIKIVYTGSAILAIDNSLGDLSRRQTMYTLDGLSFREYLQFEEIIDCKAISLDNLLVVHTSLAMEISSKTPILKHFEDYLHHAYYPYYKVSGDDYLLRLSEVTRLVIESDIPSIEPISISTVQKLKQLLMIIANTVPMEINIHKLTVQLETTRDQCLKMIYLLDRAGLLFLLTEKVKDYKHLCSPAKIYLGNTNLMSALNPHNDKEMRRETFFANQLGVISSLTMPTQGDFCVDDKYIFEVGGAKKTFRQIADVPNSYLAVDDIEIGYSSRIPLWMFGMLY